MSEKKLTVSESVDNTNNKGVKLNEKREVSAENIQSSRGNVKVYQNRLGTSHDASVARMRARYRPGYHTYWASPGEDYDRCMAGPYTQIRIMTEEDKKKGVQPGEESGEVLKLYTGDGKVELIALECPEEYFDEYLEWMSQESVRQHKAITEDFYTNIEQLNSERGSRRQAVIAGEVNADGEFKPL